jgi:hypothetical protein
MRVIIENILLFLLPTVVYVVFVMASRRNSPSAGQVLDEAPILWLIAAGAGVVLAVLLAFGSNSGGRPGQGYAPPVLKDGGVQPGQIK